ncbi:transketolase [Aminithiophilus ramosus]|uniref:Transketolase n=2 Tax=Synergistales TaxID=649776 RepID=A0A9Q7ASD4_9BACT|nr:transketolase [Aminithiophilus ramosus]QTX33096.1 transketolase [Aminithiophilus ramosus]QVL37142.1 transketolase [Synergistota bacterium]
MAFKKIALSNRPAGPLDDDTLKILRDGATTCRRWAVTMTTLAESGHPAGSLSSLEMALMTYAVADLTPDNASHLDRDYVVVSHGHTSPGVYSALAWLGFFDPQEAVAHFRQVGSPYQGHVERDLPGIDWGTGNLGQGLSAAVGFALAQRARGHSGRVFALMGDGEQVKGQNAEARRIAVKEGLSAVTVLIDMNGIQISGTTESVMAADIEALWKIDGWQVLHCDGHDIQALFDVLVEAGRSDRPSVVLCRTVMGRGVSFMEGIADYHGKTVSGDLYARAMAELGGDDQELEPLRQRRRDERPDGRNLTRYPIYLDTGEPRVYGPEKATDNRSAFGTALTDVGRLNEGVAGRTPLLVFDCDLAGSVKVDGFAAACPRSFVETGIQEHATATVAGAASAAGVVALWADFGVFGLSEAYNQQRLNDINDANVKLVLTHVGLDVGEDGKTHQAIDYIGLLRNTFGWKLVVPADPNQTDRATRWALSSWGNTCLAMGRSKLPVVTDEEGRPFFGSSYRFRYGALDVVRPGTDLTLLACGHMIHRALAAREILAGRGLSARVCHAATPLHIDIADLVEASSTGAVVTVEDHNVNSGLGSIVAMSLMQLGRPIRFQPLGVTRYGESGASDDVFAAMGLDVDAIARAAVDCLR